MLKRATRENFLQLPLKSLVKPNCKLSSYVVQNCLLVKNIIYKIIYSGKLETKPCILPVHIMPMEKLVPGHVLY